ncbi:MAG: hypothetical protein M1839_002397 [Geoglossum umbratile]|nr:MAG: hypothetical protein M1839_002397 [Geoglossum umbratile]
MSAEALGKRLLGEVKEEGLDELLHSLRLLYERYRPSQLHIPALDRLLNIFIQPSPAPQQQPAEHVVQTPNPHSLADAGPLLAKAKPAVIEITGASPYSGKTHLLYYITAVATLPSEVGDVFLNGKGGAVVVLDTDARFDVRRLKQVMEHFVMTRYLEAGSSFEYDDGLEDIIRHALLHVHIYRPQSPASLVATIDAVPSYLLYNATEHFSSGRALEAVLLDSASAFLYQDCAESDAEAIDSDAYPKPGSVFTKRHQDIVKGLRALQQTFNCAIIATTWGLFPHHPAKQHGPKPLHPPSFRPHLPPTWTSFCTLRLIIARDPVPKFGPAMSVEEAMRDAPARQEVVDRGGFSGWVDQGWGSEEWGERVWDGLRRVKGGGFFWFRVTEEGVEVDD